MKVDYSRYVISLIVTVAIFITAFYLSNFFTNKKLDSIQSIQENIAIDIMSIETQFLLKESSCSEGSDAISTEINAIGDKLTYAEGQLGPKDKTVIYLKKYYSILQIKDYILGKNIANECGDDQRPIFMIYMYSNKTNCADCEKQAAVLGRLREIYPELKIYTFDYDLDLKPLETLKAIYKIKPEFPVLVVEDEPYYGFMTVDELRPLLPDNLEEAPETDVTATSTDATTTQATPKK